MSLPPKELRGVKPTLCKEELEWLIDRLQPYKSEVVISDAIVNKATSEQVALLVGQRMGILITLKQIVSELGSDALVDDLFGEE